MNMYNLGWAIATVGMLIILWCWMEQSSKDPLVLEEYDEDQQEIIPNEKPDYSKIFDRMFDGLKWIESTNDPSAIGDEGKAIGILQIRKEYFEDAMKQPNLFHHLTHYGMRSSMASKNTMKLYMQRQIDRNDEWLTEEDLVRIHNGGPLGHTKKSTLPYLKKYQEIRQVLDQGFEPIKGTSNFVCTSVTSRSRLPVGAIVKRQFFGLK